MRALIRGIVNHDQFDDWLPDAVYYEDGYRYSDKLAAQLNRTWRSGSLSTAEPLGFDVPRLTGEDLPALCLSLEARVFSHRVIAAMAPRLSASLPADKVYGFEYRAKDKPMFTLPGDGLQEAWKQAHAAFLIHGNIRCLDVIDATHGARRHVLEDTLERLGTRSDETAFLRNVLGHRESLCSVDDAFAFLFKFFLYPVDRALFDSSL